MLTNFRRQDRKYRGTKGQELVDRTIQQTAEDVQNFLDLPRSPKVFCVNSVPDDEADLTWQQEVRKNILEYACSNKAPARLADLRVPKTVAVLKAHGEEAARLDGTIASLEEQLQQINELSTPVKQAIIRCTHEMDHAQANIKRLDAELLKLDTAELCEAFAPWRRQTPAGIWGRWDFSIESPVPIQSISHVNPGAYYHQTRLTARTVDGYFTRASAGVFESQP